MQLLNVFPDQLQPGDQQISPHGHVVRVIKGTPYDWNDNYCGVACKEDEFDTHYFFRKGTPVVIKRFWIEEEGL